MSANSLKSLRTYSGPAGPVLDCFAFTLAARRQRTFFASAWRRQCRRRLEVRTGIASGTRLTSSASGSTSESGAREWLPGLPSAGGRRRPPSELTCRGPHACWSCARSPGRHVANAAPSPLRDRIVDPGRRTSSPLMFLGQTVSACSGMHITHLDSSG